MVSLVARQAVGSASSLDTVQSGGFVFGMLCSSILKVSPKCTQKVAPSRDWSCMEPSNFQLHYFFVDLREQASSTEVHL